MPDDNLRVLIYKRTHNGDPDHHGCFGVHDCMGSVRSWQFDAVVGIGGVGPEARSNEIAGQINWIGLGPHKMYVRGKRGPLVTFDHFQAFRIPGPSIREIAPRLANRIYATNVRVKIMCPGDNEYEEVMRIISKAKNAPTSVATTTRSQSGGCVCRCTMKRKGRRCPHV